MRGETRRRRKGCSGRRRVRARYSRVAKVGGVVVEVGGETKVSGGVRGLASSLSVNGLDVAAVSVP